jgi:hypothetical protein
VIRVKKLRVCGFSNQLTLILRCPTFYFLYCMPRPWPFSPPCQASSGVGLPQMFQQFRFCGFRYVAACLTALGPRILVLLALIQVHTCRAATVLPSGGGAHEEVAGHGEGTWSYKNCL